MGIFSTESRIAENQNRSETTSADDRKNAHSAQFESSTCITPFPTVCMIDVKPEHVEWLWKDRIPFGKVTLIEGDPALGKSTVTLDIAARVSRGWSMPFDEAQRAPGGVLLISCEDGLGDTVRPRLEAAGADMQNVFAVPIIDDGAHPTFPSSADRIEAAVRERGAKLLLIDPLMAFFDEGTDTNKDASVRLTMGALARIAARTGAAVGVVRHLNKGVGKAAMYRGGGSIGIIAAARSALLVERSPDNSDQRVLARTKGNLSAPPRAVSFRLVTDHDVARVDWLGELDAEVTADTLLAANDKPRVKKPLKTNKAKEFLLEYLGKGPRPVKEIESAASKRGISASGALKRAREEIGIEPTRVGDHWVWALPVRNEGGSTHDAQEGQGVQEGQQEQEVHP